MAGLEVSDIRLRSWKRCGTRSPTGLMSQSSRKRMGRRGWPSPQMNSNLDVDTFCRTDCLRCRYQIGLRCLPNRSRSVYNDIGLAIDQHERAFELGTGLPRVKGTSEMACSSHRLRSRQKQTKVSARVQHISGRVGDRFSTRSVDSWPLPRCLVLWKGGPMVDLAPHIGGRGHRRAHRPDRSSLHPTHHMFRR